MLALDFLELVVELQPEERKILRDGRLAERNRKVKRSCKHESSSTLGCLILLGSVHILRKHDFGDFGGR